MRKSLIAMVGSLLTLSGCYTLIIQEKTGSDAAAGLDQPVGDVTVVTGIAYPEGVDWNISGLDHPQARVVMYENRELKVNLGTGESAGVACCDPYQHICCGGHLYSVFLSETETVLSCDGTPVMRLDGRKFLLAIRDGGEKLRTLWENEGGRGFVSLHGEEILYESREGSPFRNIGTGEEGELCFFYSVPVKSSSGMITQYYFVEGSEAIQMDLPKQLRVIFGFIRSPEGFKVLCRNEGNRMNYELYDTSDGNSMLLFPSVNGQLTALSNELPALVHASLTHPVRGTEWNVISLDGIQAADWETDDIATGFTRLDRGVGGVRRSRLKEGRDILVRESVCDTLPAGYSVMTDGAVHISPSGKAKIGLSSRSGGKALLWSDGEIDTLGFRGVVTGIYVLKRNREEEAETIRTTRPTEGRNHIFTPN